MESKEMLIKEIYEVVRDTHKDLIKMEELVLGMRRDRKIYWGKNNGK